MASYYEFQKEFPKDEACLKDMMVSRYGGTNCSARRASVTGNSTA